MASAFACSRILLCGVGRANVGIPAVAAVDKTSFDDASVEGIVAY